MNNEPNILALTDSYKVTHYPQYPKGTTRVMAFLESRGGRYDQVLFFGLQAIIKKYLVGQVVTEEKIQEAKAVFVAHFGTSELFNEQGWRYILEKHHGKLPVVIKAVPEGTRVTTSNVLMTIVNTDPEVPWLTNYLESLLVQVWYPTTVATQSWHMKQIIRQYLEETGSPELIDFKLHDFGFRGSTSVESAGIGGAAHLVNFKGTDTIEALLVARRAYGEPMAGFSIPAAEHSTITSWGRGNEVAAYRNMLEKFPKGLVAVVSDSFNIYRACEEMWGGVLKDEVLARDGVLIIRPDSGDPLVVIPKVLEILGAKFGYEVNSKGFKVLHPKVRIIQGDGVDYQTVGTIFEVVKQAGWSADNIAFGSGGGLLQKIDRDTQRFAFKCCAIEVDGEWRDVIKDPITDPGKKSKAGQLALVKEDGIYKTVPAQFGQENILRPVFWDGVLMVDQTFAEIRERAL